MSERGQRILVIGKSTPLLEGVSDLLQLAGYQVATTSSWSETEYAKDIPPPNLTIVDLSSAPSDVYRLSEQIRETSHWAKVPILFVSFSGDERIWDLQRHSQKKKNDHGRVEFYTHTLLSMNGLLDKVQACLS